MNRSILKLLCIGSLLAIFLFCAFTPIRGIKKKKKQELVAPLKNLENSFKNPTSVQTSVYWYWISDNISKEGVVKDLEAMKKAGINRAFIGNIGLNDVPYGKIKIFSPEWWDILHTALKTATKLNIEIGIFNGPGWSQSGGPWIKPEQSMRYLASSQIEIKGGQDINTQLPKPGKDFQDVRVITFPVSADFSASINTLNPTLSSEPGIDSINNITDDNFNTAIHLKAHQPITINFDIKKNYTVRSITINTTHVPFKLEGDIEARVNNSYVLLKHFNTDRSNPALNTGFIPFGPAAITIPATVSNSFKIKFTNVSAGLGITEIKLSSTPVVENYIEKTLAKMWPTPHPLWDAYQWQQQPPEDSKYIIAPSKIIDITKYMKGDGTLKWKVPKGSWIVMRMGMLPTGVTNAPASKEGTGLEVDKMSRLHVAEHFNSFLGQIIKKIPAEDRKTWKVTVEDSYETGGQNWTDSMIDEFKTTFGYDPVPYLPAMQGFVVGSEDMSDRFLWDLRRFIADKVAYEYVGGLRDISHKYGLHTWLENYGHWGFPSEFLEYGGQSDEVAGEFWSEGTLGNIENRVASSCAHIYGKNKVSAESFTAGGKPFARYPALMKQRGDRFFTEGINNTLLHVYIEQPDDKKVPGINAPFGNEFNRLNTWFGDLDLFTNYLKRCNLLLQHGKYVADAAYFIGEDAPKMTGVRDPELPKGYSYDYINAEVIMTRLSVRNGKLILPDGMTYRILVLPKLETMRPELLAKIKDLVQEGAVILGPKPTRSPGLENYPEADISVKRMADLLWGNINGKNIKVHKYGKGMVIEGIRMQQALDLLRIPADYDPSGTDSTLFIHRSTTDADIYFISNQSQKTIEFNPSFRIAGRQPEYWNPLTGDIRNLPAYKIQDGKTVVPLKLFPLQSAFIIFRKKAVGAESADLNLNFPQPKILAEINTPWTVNFDTARWASAQPVIFNKLEDWSLRPENNIKYYSGTVIYFNTFICQKPQKGSRIFLDLGSVIAMAKIKVNGQYAGGVWTAPYRVDITDVVKTGKNNLSIEVCNTWANRLIGDSRLPEKQRKTWTSISVYNSDSPLQSSGLLGPVKLEVIKE